MSAPADRPISKRMIAYTQGLDPTKNFVGSGPEPGDLGFVGLMVPELPTVDQQHRYLFRLLTIPVGEQFHARILSIRQLLTICAKVPTSEPVDEETPRLADDVRPTILLERQVITPTWTFPDGNVSWHLRTTAPKATPDSPRPVGIPAGWSRDLFGMDPALVTLTDASIATPYVAPSHGIPPGEIIMDWKDMRYPWYSRGNHSGVEIDVAGPCDIILYASVHQTDPATRVTPTLAPGSEMFTTDCGIEPEDKFWTAFPDSARYFRIGAELVVNIYPLEQLRRDPLSPETKRSP